MRKTLIIAAAVIVGMVASSIGGAYAATRFSDVPESSPFYDDIEWMVDAGITTGYEDGTFKPGQPVTRQAMAAFMRRAFESFELISGETSVYEYEGEIDEGFVWELRLDCGPGRRPLAGFVDSHFRAAYEGAEGSAWVYRHGIDVQGGGGSPNKTWGSAICMPGRPSEVVE